MRALILFMALACLLACGHATRQKGLEPGMRFAETGRSALISQILAASKAQGDNPCDECAAKAEDKQEKQQLEEVAKEEGLDCHPDCPTVPAPPTLNIGGAEGLALAGDDAIAKSAEQLEVSVNQAATRSSEERAQALNKEIQTLEKLISHAKDIQKAIPEKERRLAQLKGSLESVAEVTVEKEATNDLEQQQDLLLEINTKIQELKAKLGELEATKVKIEKEIARLEAEANGITPEDLAKAGTTLDGEAGSEVGSTSGSGAGAGAGAGAGSTAGSAAGAGSTAGSAAGSTAGSAAGSTAGSASGAGASE